MNEASYRGEGFIKLNKYVQSSIHLYANITYIAFYTALLFKLFGTWECIKYQGHHSIHSFPPPWFGKTILWQLGSTVGKCSLHGWGIAGSNRKESNKFCPHTIRTCPGHISSFGFGLDLIGLFPLHIYDLSDE